MRNRFLMILGVVFLAGLGCDAAANRPPNFVFIFIDDLGYGDIAPFGSKLNRTPNLDRMTEQGMRLTSFYGAPVCSVSRAQVLTGCYGVRVSVPGVFFPAGPKGLNPDEITIAEQLRDLGYATACIGKWHLGDQPPFLPTNHGFDYYYGIPYSNDMDRKSKADGRMVHPLLRNDKVIGLLERPDQSRITENYTKEAVQFIRKNKDKPFFLYLPHTAVHVPIYPGARFAGKSKNGRYGDWVEEIDWSAGEVLRTLRELKLDQNTLVIFTSDNGPWASKGTDGGVSGPLRGAKGGTFEGGVRVPTVAWWPGKIAAGSESDIVAGNIDLLPTFVSLAGGKTATKFKIDGKDFSDVLFGKAKKSAHEAWYYYRGTGLKAVRSGRWKLALGAQSEGMGLKTTDPVALSKELKLYDLEADLGETRDVAKDNPGVVKRLRKLADAMIADLGSGKAGPGVRPPGIVDDPVTLYPTEPRKRSPKKNRAPKSIGAMKVGDKLDPANAPVLVKAGFTISCEVDSKDGSGIVVGHGGSAVGYSIYLHDGAPVFAMRNGDNVSRVIGSKIRSRQFRLEMKLNAKGVVELLVDGKSVGSGEIGTLARHPQEAFCVGYDEKNPVDNDSPKGSFAGKIRNLKVELSR